jgi:hypothetical protein
LSNSVGKGEVGIGTKEVDVQLGKVSSGFGSNDFGLEQEDSLRKAEESGLWVLSKEEDADSVSLEIPPQSVIESIGWPGNVVASLTKMMELSGLEGGEQVEILARRVIGRLRDVQSEGDRVIGGQRVAEDIAGVARSGVGDGEVGVSREESCEWLGHESVVLILAISKFLEDISVKSGGEASDHVEEVDNRTILEGLVEDPYYYLVVEEEGR